MKKFLPFLLMLLALMPLPAVAVVFRSLPSGLPADSVTLSPVRTVSETDDGIIVSYTFSGFALTEEPDATHRLMVGGFGAWARYGLPALVSRTDTHFIPLGCDAQVSLIESAYTDIRLTLASGLIPMPESATPDTVATAVIPITPYTGFLPGNPVAQLKSGEYRGHTLAKVEVTPALYDYENSTLRFYHRITYKITFTGTTPAMRGPSAGNHAEIGSWMQPVPPTATTVSTRSGQQPPAVNADAGYLIITVPEYKDPLKEFVEWKQLLGYNVTVLTDNNWTPESIKAAVREQYRADNSLMYLLLVGTNDEVPGELIPEKHACGVYPGVNYGIKLDPHLTDYYYGCTGDETDDTPDLYRGRWPVWDYDDLTTVMNKTLWYEQQPTTDSLFYRKATHCAYFQHHDTYKTSELHRFVETSEETRTYMQTNQNKEIERLYWSAWNAGPQYPPQHWNCYGLGSGWSLPDDLRNDYDWSAKSFTDLAPAINDGRLYVLYRGHGGQERLVSHTTNNYYFDRTNIRQLDNTEWQPLFFSICCSTGDYSAECFADILLTRRGGGSMAALAASAVSYSGYNDALTCGMFNTIWPTPGYTLNMSQFSIDPVPEPSYQLGAILDSGLHRGLNCYSATDTVVSYTKELFHLFGDPSVMFTTEVPSEYSSVSVDSTATSVTVDLGYDTGFIAFYDHVLKRSRRYYGSQATYFTDHPGHVSVSVSDHNRITYVQRGEEFYPDGEPFLPPNRIDSCIDNGNYTITVNYTLSPTVKNAYIVVVNLSSNNIVAQVPCPNDTNSIGAHVPYGVYAVSLMVNDYPAYTTKLIVSHYSYY